MDPQTQSIVDNANHAEQGRIELMLVDRGHSVFFQRKADRKLRILLIWTGLQSFYRFSFCLLCLAPIIICISTCFATSINIVFIILLSLEMQQNDKNRLKLSQGMYLSGQIYAHIREIKTRKEKAIVPFHSEDLNSLHQLNAIVSAQSKLCMGFLFLLNMVFFCFYFVYVAIFVNYLSQQIEEQRMQKYFFIIIWVLDTTFFILPKSCVILRTIFFLIYDLIEKYRSVNQRILRRLKSTLFKEGMRVSEENICIICWDQFKPQDQFVSLPCNKMHVFHYQCVRIWLKRCVTCPVCRQVLN